MNEISFPSRKKFVVKSVGSIVVITKTKESAEISISMLLTITNTKVYTDIGLSE